MTPLQTEALAQIKELLGGECARVATLYRPSYVMAHITEESSWNPDAVSSDGQDSVGLMQCTAATAREFGSTPEAQHDPATSILTGMRELQSALVYLEEKLRRPVEIADLIAAYNEGQGNVVRGVQDPGYVARVLGYQREWAYVDGNGTSAAAPAPDQASASPTAEDLNAAELKSL